VQAARNEIVLRVDVTGGLVSGRNVVEVELVGTLRNLLGPHHVTGADSEFTGPMTTCSRPLASTVRP